MAIGGVFGQWVQIQDGRNKYVRSAVADGFPLSMWSNRWSTMPVTRYPNLRLPDPDARATLDTMPGTEIPVIRQPFQPGDLLPYWAMMPKVGEHHLYPWVAYPKLPSLQARLAGELEAEPVTRDGRYEHHDGGYFDLLGKWFREMPWFERDAGGTSAS